MDRQSLTIFFPLVNWSPYGIQPCGTFGMMNIGFNPTVSGTEKSIEVNFFEFEGDLYDKKVQVAILHRIRDEYKFDSVEELREQLKKDKKQSLTLISKWNAR